MTGKPLARVSTTLSLVNGYRNAIKRHLGDLDAAIHDLQYQISGNRIVYAVDFTEINSFVLPTEEALSVPVLSQEEEFEQISLNIVTLNYIFFGAEADPIPPVVLLPPHRLELRQHEFFFHNAALDQFHALAAKAEAELRNVQKDVQLHEILSALESANHLEERTAAEGRLLVFLNTNASNLLLIATSDAGFSAASRLRQLLDRANLIDLKDIVGRPVHVNEIDQRLASDLQRILSRIRLSRLSEEQFKSLSKQKLAERERLNRGDALAAAYVLRANDLLSSGARERKLKRVILLSRSNTLIRAVEEFSVTFGKYRLGQFVRRPSATLAGLLQPGVDLTDQLTNLKNRQTTLELALNALVQRAESSIRYSEDDDETLKESVQDLRELWRKSINLAVAAGNWRIPNAPSKSEFSKIVSALRDRQEFMAIVTRAAANLAAQINISNALLARSRRNLEDIGAAKIEFPPSTRGKRKPVLVWGADTSSTLGLYFYHTAYTSDQSVSGYGVDALERLLNRHRRRPLAPHRLEADAHDNKNLLQSDPTLIESCLASSLFEAISENWNLAETFAQLAVNWSERDDPTPKHEAYYMLAVCRLRCGVPTEESLKAGLDDLREASELLRRNGLTVPDVRILMETGKHYFQWWEHLEYKGRYEEGLSFKPITDEANASEPASDNYKQAVRLFRQVKQILENGEERNQLSFSSSRQLVDVTNALCYAHIMGVGPDDRAFRLLVELSKAVKASGWTDSTMPTPILDTICWTLFCLRARFDERGWLQRTAAELAGRLDRYGRHQKDRRVIEAHLDLIESTYKFGLTWTRSKEGWPQEATA